MARLSRGTRYKVVLLHHKGLTQAKISKQVGLSSFDFQGLLKKHKETGKAEDCSGQPRKLADERNVMFPSL